MGDTVQKKLDRVEHHGGLERVLQVLSGWILGLGIVGFLAIWAVAGDRGSGWAGFLAGASQLVTAVVVWVVLRALAEIIRLQKKAVGLRYGGEISEVREERFYCCAACGEAITHETWCYTCNKAVEGGATESGGARPGRGAD